MGLLFLSITIGVVGFTLLMASVDMPTIRSEHLAFGGGVTMFMVGTLGALALFIGILWSSTTGEYLTTIEKIEVLECCVENGVVNQYVRSEIIDINHHIEMSRKTKDSFWLKGIYNKRFAELDLIEVK
jgi:hypothetical protein